MFEIEPLPADHPLWGFPNVILTPHVAGYSPRIAERHLAVLVENVRRFAAGEPLLNVVDKRRMVLAGAAGPRIRCITPLAPPCNPLHGALQRN